MELFKAFDPKLSTELGRLAIPFCQGFPNPPGKNFPKGNQKKSFNGKMI
jgi:hypothetical protein